LNTLSDILNSNDHVEFLSPSAEKRLIKQAQEGNERAFETLLKSYVPALRRAVGRPPSNIEREEVQAQLLLSFTEAVMAADDSLALIIGNYLARGLSELGIDGVTFSIPPRTLSRFLSILKKGEGDIVRGMEIASQHSMKPETFLAIHKALRLNGSLDELLEGDEHPDVSVLIEEASVDETTEYLVNTVFEFRDDANDFTADEVEVVYLAYGFDVYAEARTDEHTAHILGTTRSRVQRLRTKALGKARDRLGL